MEAQNTTWIDVHCHLDKLEDDGAVSIPRAFAAGVQKIITIGTGPEDHPFIVEAVNKWSPNVFGTLGVHPHDANQWTPEVKKYIEDHIHHPRIVAVGEIGLDYYYNHSDKETQIRAFREQLELSITHNMPVEIHTRDAEEDTVKILNDYKGQAKGLIHCFTGTQYLADEVLKLGFHISISGVVTFKSAEALREVVTSIPLDAIHVETDAPFLAPVPCRGQQNKPELILHTAEKVAQLKGVSIGDLKAQVYKNALKIFPKLKS